MSEHLHEAKMSIENMFDKLLNEINKKISGFEMEKTILCQDNNRVEEIQEDQTNLIKNGELTKYFLF